jgi:hypothetical protein
MKRLYKSITFFATILILLSCSEIKTEDPKKAFQFWLGIKAPKDVELIKADYWQSAHWSKEYILFLEFKPSEIWWNECIKQNGLKLDTTKWNPPDPLPIWFKPTHNSTMYKQKGQLGNDSRYFRDKATGICFIYEIQL